MTANRVCILNNGVVYAGAHMAVIKDGKVVGSTADLNSVDLRGATFEDYAELLESIKDKLIPEGEIVRRAADHLSTGHFSKPCRAFECGCEAASADRAAVIGRRVIKDVDRSFVIGD